MDADQGFMQKIFYVHVPLAIVALGGFVFGGVMAIQHLRTRDARYDLRSYVAIHLSLVLGALVGVGRAHAGLLPRRLPALRDLPAAALLDRGPRAPGALRERLRNHRGGLRPAELPGRAPGPG